MASAFLLFILFCVFIGGWAIKQAFKEADGYKMIKEAKWLIYKKEGEIVCYKTRWAEQ